MVKILIFVAVFLYDSVIGFYLIFLFIIYVVVILNFRNYYLEFMIMVFFKYEKRFLFQGQKKGIVEIRSLLDKYVKQVWEISYNK